MRVCDESCICPCGHISYYNMGECLLSVGYFTSWLPKDVFNGFNGEQFPESIVLITLYNTLQTSLTSYPILVPVQQLLEVWICASSTMHTYVCTCTCISVSNHHGHLKKRLKHCQHAQ